MQQQKIYCSRYKVSFLATLFLITILICCTNSTSSTKQDDADKQEAPTKTKKLIAPSSADHPRRRWHFLYDMLFDDSHSDNLSIKLEPNLVYKILTEMNELEKKIYKFPSSKTLDYKQKSVGGGRFTLTRYLQLKRFLVNTDASLSDTLLDIFNIESIDCSEIGIRKLDNIIDTLKTFPIHEALLVNKKIQYVTCWNRYMVSLDSLEQTISKKYLTDLNKILQRIMGNQSGLLPKFADLWLGQATSAKKKYAHLVADFLHEKLLHRLTELENARLDFGEEYRLSIKEPCHSYTFIANRLVKVIYRIYGNSIGDYGMTSDHARMLNLYEICSSLLVDRDIMQMAREKRFVKPIRMIDIDGNRILESQANQSRPQQQQIQPDLPDEPVQEAQEQPGELVAEPSDMQEIGNITLLADTAAAVYEPSWQLQLGPSNSKQDEQSLGLTKKRQITQLKGPEMYDKSWLNLGLSKARGSVSNDEQADQIRQQSSPAEHGLIFESLPVELGQQKSPESSPKRFKNL